MLNQKVKDELQGHIDSSNKYQSQEVFKALDCLINHASTANLTTEFETEFARLFHVKHAISCNSGTSGLHAALFAAGIGPGDEVIVPALTVVMDAYAVLHLGGTPVFADVDESTHLVTAQTIKRVITKKTKAIITVSWDGISCDMDPIMAFAKDAGICVIDDSARTVMGRYKGRIAGTIADMSVFSFEAKKHLTTGGEGGMVVTDNNGYATRVRKFAGIGYKHMTADAGRTHLATETVQHPDYKRFDTVGLNYRLNALSAAVGLGQLARLDEIISLRKEIGNLYLKKLSGFDWFIPQKTPVDCEHSYYTFSVDYRGQERYGVSWKAFYDLVKSRGGDGFYGCVSVPYLEPALEGKLLGEKALGYGIAPVAEALQPRLMCFKTNYRNIELAKEKISIIKTVLDELNTIGQ